MLRNGCSVRLAGSESICHSAAQHLHTSLDIHDAAANFSRILSRFREACRDFSGAIATVLRDFNDLLVGTSVAPAALQRSVRVNR